MKPDAIVCRTTFGHVFIMDLLLPSYLYNNIISGSEIKIHSNFIQKTFRIYQITIYNVTLWKNITI